MYERLTPDKKNNSTDIDIRLKAILDTAVDGIICINSDGVIDLFNLSAEKMFGYSSEEVIGKNVNILMPEPYASEHDEYIARYERTGIRKIIGIGREIFAKRKNGEIFPIELAVSEVEIDGKRLYTGIIRDITRRKEAEQQIEQYQKHLEKSVEARTQELTEANKKLEKLANVDGLTGIANRRHFNKIIVQEIRRAARNNDHISLIMCDIDHFKPYNDHYGHVSGDECLQKIASCLKQIFMRAADLPARYGGEEFAIILPNTDQKEAKKLAEKFVRQIDSLNIPHAYSSVSDRISVSTGIVSVIPGKNFSDKDLIKAADQALYDAKKKGRNRIEIYQQ